jgi:hypothetical protein
MKAIADYRVNISREEAIQLFSVFDINGDGEVNYDEFLRSVVGEMNTFRKALVRRAFQKIDKDKSGTLTIEDIQGVYNAKHHPDVKTGKKTEDEILYEFLDTFEMHHSLKNPDQKDRIISQDEFTEYYNNISVSIDDDRYFEVMMTNAWNLNNTAPV